MDQDLITRHVASTATVIGLPIADEYRAGVERYFGIAASLATLVMTMPLSAADEPAEVFVPVSPEAG